MKTPTILFFLFLLSVAAFAQKTKPVKNPLNSSKSAGSSKSAASEKETLAKAAAITDANRKIAALEKFNADFPNSTEKNSVLESIVAARAAAADEKLRGGDVESGVRLFKAAVESLPAPVSDKLFTEIVLQIPNNLFFQGQRAPAGEVARTIEKKIENNAKQLLGLATFYLAIENGDEAERLAGKAVALEPNQPAAYQTLGIASRLNFNLDAAADYYSKALELAPDSIVSKRSLAEMRRATGNPEKAVELYREILAKEAGDKSARTGLILALFDAGQKAEAEDEMTKALAQNPNNLLLLVGASYWYAANRDSAKAVELAQKALAVEPRYIWAYVALARGFLRQNRLTDAERALLAARNYGSFPTLDYELATVRLAAGFYREAAQEMAKNFTVENDSVGVKLGGRVARTGKNFTELLAPERAASIFEPLAADDADSARKLKELLVFYRKSEAPAAEAEIIEAADNFIAGDDKMRLYRRIYVADRLLDKTEALPKIVELMRAAGGEVETALGAASPVSATLADRLFESRSIAVSRNEIVIVPDVPRQTLSNILRGRIEEITGWALYKSDKTGEAVVRLKRAVSILPENSAWRRSALWRLGAALQTDGKSTEALDAYLKSYPTDAPDAAKRVIIEGLYKQINGTLDGLDAKIGAKPAPVAAVASSVRPEIAPPPVAAKSSAPTPEIPAPDENPPTAPEMPPRTKEKPAEKQPPARVNPTIEKAVEKTEKPLFEPVIITVPQTSAPPKNKAAASGIDGAKISECKIISSQESISLVNNGGSLGILVGFEDKTLDAAEINAVSGSVKDLTVTFEPEIGGASNRAFFIVKSVSDAKGVYTILFEAVCGKKEITVRIR